MFHADGDVHDNRPVRGHIVCALDVDLGIKAIHGPVGYFAQNAIDELKIHGGRLKAIARRRRRRAGVA